MSQSRKFKVPKSAEYAFSNGDNGPRHNLSMARTLKGLQSRSTQPNECRRKKSTNKIPKSLRYDLESALVGLCDVWFENIKPHLVRNNIKLHVHNTEAAADAACACGDFQTSAMPPCTHLDPGAATDLHRQKDACYVGSCATQPIASEAPCFRPRVSICQNRSSRECRQKMHQNSEIPILFKNKCKRQPRRVSRKCQTSAIVPAPMTEPTLSIKDLHIRNLFKSVFNKVPICPPTTPLSALRRHRKIVSMASQTFPQMYCTLDNPCSLSRRQDTTPLTYDKMQQSCQNQPILFQNDLIDIIGKRNDEILRDISKSQEKVGYPSLINLVSPRDRHKNSALKKNPPWR